MTVNSFGYSYKPSPKAGFTLIELMIVIGIMIVLSTLSITGIVRSLRAASVNSAASALRLACATAQDRAMMMVDASAAEYPGVMLANRNGRWAVAVISATASQASSADWDSATLDEEGLPAIAQFSPNVVVWEGDSPASISNSYVWFYEPASGAVVAPTSAGFSDPGAVVGTSPPPLFSGGKAMVYGAKADSLTVIAPPTATNPGLSIRSRDQRSKRSLSVQASGVLELRRFD